MSSEYSRTDGDCAGGWRGGRQGGNRGVRGRDGGQGSNYSGGRAEINHSRQDNLWNKAKVNDETSNGDEYFNNDGITRGRGFSRQNRPEASNYQTQDRAYKSEDRRGEVRGRGFNFNVCNDDDNHYGDDALSGWDDGSSNSESGGGYRAVLNTRDGQEWESGFNNLTINESEVTRGRGYGRQNKPEENSNPRQERGSFSDGFVKWKDNSVGRTRGDNEEGGDRQSSYSKGGFRGGKRGFRDSRNNDDSEGNTSFESYDVDGQDRSRGGSRFGRRDDGDQQERQKGRGGGGGNGRGYRGNDDDDYGEYKAKREVGEDDKPRERYIPPEPANDEQTMFSSSISTGNNFSKYDNIPVKISGDNVPKPINSFEECNFKDLLLDNIRKSGYTKPTPVQKHALPAISSGRDVMGCAQTGSGKTAAFLLPIIHVLLKEKIDLIAGEWAEPQAVICSPTRELAQQIFNEARKFAFGSIIKIAIAYGGTATFYQASKISKGCHILVATPGRLNDFVDRGKIKFTSCRFFVLDEADRMLDMGFLPAIEKMLDHETMTPKGQRQTLMFSATFPDEIQRLAANYLHEYLFLAVGIVGGACSDVEQNFHLVPRFDKKDKLIEILSAAEEKELTLVFVEKQRTADFIAAFLSENNFPTTSIHGARLQSQREQALADFKCGRMPTLVATAVAARGLDIKNVTHVVNFDMPSSVDEYVHRIGRTGRVGNRGKATSFYDPDVDGHLVTGLTRILEQSDQIIPSFFDGANDPPSSRIGGAGFRGRRSQNFGGHDVRGNEDNFFHPAPAVVNEEAEEAW